MPFSTSYFKQQTKEYILNNYKDKSIKILDIGAGAGAYHNMLSPEGYTNIDCVEAFPNYVIDYNLTQKYKKVILGDVTKIDINFDEYDLIILGDVLEHIELETAKILLNKIKRSNVIIGVPFNSSQGVHFDNTYEIHLQEDLTFINFFQRFEDYKPFCLRFDYGLFVKENNNKVIFVETQQNPIPEIYQTYINSNFSEYKLKDVDDKYHIETTPPTINNDIKSIKNQLSSLSKEEKENLIKYLSTPQIDVTNKDLTVVTGLWNIGRPGRDFSHYIEHFKKFLEIPVNMFIYIPKEYEYLVWEKRSKENTYVKIYELEEDIKNNIYKPHWDKTQKIRTNPEWFNKTGEHGWLKNSPQAILEWYNPIVQSKMFLLHSASIWNPFNTEYFVWLDAGITNTVHESFFVENRVLDKINPYLDSFLFLSYPYDAVDEIHGFDFKAMNNYTGEKVKYVCRGGLFGGNKETINQASGFYYAMLEKSLNEGHMGTEESIFTLMSYIEPEKYRRYALDGNGLIVKFTQALLNSKVELESIPDNRVFLKPKNLDTSNLKTSLYMLTFNFPEQVRHTLKTYENHPNWLDKTRKILIDNSNNEEAIAGNKAICEEYNMEHIITGENLGINRGRLRAAEHFQASDSDYYIFLEDDMGLHAPIPSFCRNGFKTYVPNLYNTIHKIMLKEEFDFLKLSFTEVYMDNNIQCSWYNVPQPVRIEIWPEYNKLPIQGLDPNCPRTRFNKIDVLDGTSYADGDIYYANWPMIVSKKGNQKMFLDIKWAHPYEQTWMSHMFQETRKGNLKPGILLASPINHNRIVYYDAHERREN